MNHNLKSFIEGVLINEIENILIKNNHHYLSFGLMSQGIEFLGACIDNKEFHVQEKSGDRFRNSLKKLFPNKYRQFANKNSDYDLYTNLRCGLLHVLIPKGKIELIQENEKKKFNTEHLQISNVRGNLRLVLVSQDMFTDFKKACEKVIKMYDENKLNGNNVSGIILSNDS